MEYFNSYSDVAYRFGNEEYTVSAQDISTYRPRSRIHSR